MRWQLPFVFVLLVGPGLAGCLAADDDTLDVADGHGHVRIHVQRPLEMEKYPELWSLEVVPRLVLFFAGDNDTRTRLDDSGYVDVANGWPADWSKENQTKAYPESALQDWMRPSGVWYEGEVPAGNYSLIRVEFVHLAATHSNGREVAVRAVADRLSVGAPEGGFFTVREGERHNFALSSMITAESEYYYEIR